MQATKGDNEVRPGFLDQGGKFVTLLEVTQNLHAKYDCKEIYLTSDNAHLIFKSKTTQYFDVLCPHLSTPLSTSIVCLASPIKPPKVP